MTTIHFIRHGQVDDPDNIFYGRLPGFPMSAQGVAEITQRATKLASLPIVAVYTSPMLRTRQSAEIIASQFKLQPILDERVIEIASPYEGRKRDATLKLAPSQPVYSESMEQVYDRMTDFLHEMVSNYPDEVIVAVCHGGPIRILEMGIKHQPFTDTGYILDPGINCAQDLIVVADNDTYSTSRSES